MRAIAPPPPPTPPHRKSGLPDLRSIMRNPGKPGFRGEGSRPCSRRRAGARMANRSPKRTRRSAPDAATEAILRHWREAVPNDRLAHLVKDATRGLLRALQMRLSKYGVAFGHWAFLRILWETDGLTQRELSDEAGLREPTTSSARTAIENLGYITRRRMLDNRKNV